MSIVNYKKGLLYEYLAMLFLLLKGYRILKRRYRNKCGEIDIIASKQNVVVFIEVKYRRSDSSLNDLLTNRQVRRINNSADLFMAYTKRFEGYQMRFDIFFFSSFLSIKHIENAW